jgi:MFS family permease
VIPAFVGMVSGPFARAMLTAFFFFGGLNAFVLLPLYIHQLGGTEASIGEVQGIYSATGIVCQPLVGAWIDRLGRKRFMLLGTSLLIVASGAFTITSSIPAIAVLRSLQGVAFSAVFV